MVNLPCPWLPEVAELLDHRVTRRHGGCRGAAFYQDALRYAQSQWMVGKPAQAVLQLDKAWMADLDGGDPVLESHPPPYRALAWLMREAGCGSSGYIGNPLRHFQHLATRVRGPRAEVRAWRAWFCFHLSGRLLPEGRFPRDGKQLAREGFWTPGWKRALREIERTGWAGEADLAATVFEESARN